MDRSTPWRETAVELGPYLRAWRRGEEWVRVTDVSGDEFYKVNYIIEDENELRDAVMALCDVAECVADEFGIIPEGSVWRDDRTNELYVVEDSNPATSERTDDVPENVSDYVYCHKPANITGFVRRDRFVGDESHLEVVDWRI